MLAVYPYPLISLLLFFVILIFHLAKAIFHFFGCLVILLSSHVLHAIFNFAPVMVIPVVTFSSYSRRHTWTSGLRLWVFVNKLAPRRLLCQHKLYDLSFLAISLVKIRYIKKCRGMFTMLIHMQLILTSAHKPRKKWYRLRAICQ